MTRIVLCLLVLAVASANAAELRSIQTLINASRNVAASAYRSVDQPRDVDFSTKAGPTHPDDKAFVAKLNDKCSLGDTYRIQVEPTSADGSIILAAIALPQSGESMWKQYLTNAEAKELKESVKARLDEIERGYESRRSDLESELERVENSKVQQRGGLDTDKNRRKQIEDDKKRLKKKLRELNSREKKEKDEAEEKLESPYKSKANARRDESGTIAVKIHVPSSLGSASSMAHAKRLDLVVSINDIMVQGHAADRRADSYCRNLFPSIRGINLVTEEIRRVLE
jgi:hypothetical protein